MPNFFSGDGDDGYTGLLGEGRVPKYHARPQAYGDLDEASAALGLARSMVVSEETAQVLRILQTDLYHIMAELAAPLEHAARFRQMDHKRVKWLEAQLEVFGGKIEMPKEFVMAGDSLPGAALDLARTIVRRAERRVVELQHTGQIENESILPYLNRLSSLCFLLGMWETKVAGVSGVSLSKGGQA
jgi:cob(I)alamin adenosyltransferase